MSAPSPFADLSRGGSPDLALFTDERRFTFAELAALGGNFMAALTASGVRRGDRVALRGSSRAETVAALLAMAQAGVVAVLVHPRLTATEAAGLIADAEVARALDDAAVDALLRDGVNRPWPAGPAPLLDDPLAMIYTSGTSGRAKAAVLTHRSFAHSAAANWRHLGRRPEDRWVASLPLAHVGGLSVLTRCLLVGRPVMLLPRFDAAAVLAAVRAGGTIVSVVPTMLRALLEADGDDVLAKARAVLVGGAACAPSLLAEAARRGVRALATYGLTEMCSQVATQSPGGSATTAPGGVGRPLPGVALRIAGDDGAEVARGTVGRITLRGPMRMRGYWRQPPLAEGEWFDTGDLGSVDGDGALSVHARRTDLIVTGGENVYPAEVEQCLEAHPGVAAALVFGLPDEVWGQRVAAAVVARGEVADEAAWRASLAEHIAARLAGFKRPRALARVAAIAALPSGKPDRAGAAARYGAAVTAWAVGVSSRA